MKKYALLLFVLNVTPVLALDTTEEFGPGFSDLEIYGTLGKGEAYGLEGVAGFGAGAYLNPSIALSGAFQSAANSAAMSVANFSTFKVGAGDMNFDLIPALGWDFESSQLSGALDLELSLSFEHFTPFIQGGMSRSFTDGSSTEYFLAPAISWVADEGVEFLAQVSFEGDSFKTLRYGLGANLALASKTELISDFSFTQDDWAATLGAIFTLDN